MNSFCLNNNNLPRPRRVSFSSEACYFEAVRNGNQKEMLRILKEHHSDVDSLSTSYGRRALHICAASNDLNMCKFLLIQCKAFVNVVDDNGDTPLHRACAVSRILSHLDVVKFLLSNGAAMDVLNAKCQLPLDMTKFDFLMEDFMRSELARRGINGDEVRNAERLQLMEWAKQWLETGENPRPFIDNNRGVTLAHFVAARKYYDVYEIIKKCPNANLNALDVDGKTPKQLIGENKNFRVPSKALPSCLVSCMTV